MSPLLTTYAGDALTNYGFERGGVAASFELISTTTLGVSATSISFSSIPTNYTHLQVRVVGRTDYASGTDTLKLVFNGTGGTNYWSHWMNQDNASSVYTTNTGAAGIAYISLQNFPGNTAPASSFGSSIIDIPDYQDTNKYKTARNISGMISFTGNPWSANFMSGWFNSTAAITSITVSPLNGTNLVAGTRIALYGVKGTL